MLKIFNPNKHSLLSIPPTVLNVIGVAGTRGKTSTAHMLQHLLGVGGLKTGFITSLGYSVDGENIQKDIVSNSMSASDLTRLFQEMISNGVTHVVMEVNSSRIKNKVFDGLTFDSGILTNIFFDSPGRYIDWFDYAGTKIDFLSRIRDGGLVIFNNHNKDVSDWILSQSEAIPTSLYSYWIDFSNVQNIRHSFNDLSFEFEDEMVTLPSVGSANILNAIQSLKLAQSYVPSISGSSSFNSFKPLPGRMEVIQREPFTIIVDYSYSLDSFEDTLQYISLVKGENSKIISVIGSSDERFESKKNIGAIASMYSSLVVLVAEDPRTESTQDINTALHEIAADQSAVLLERISSPEEYAMTNIEGLKDKIQKVLQNGDIPFVAFDAEDYTSRLNGIDFAIKSADVGDVIFIVGKGDEDTLAFSHVDYEWSDGEAVRQSLLG